MPKRKYVEVEKDGKRMLVSRQMLRVDHVKLASGEKSERFFLTVPKPLGEFLYRNGVAMLEVIWDKDNPWEFRVVALKTERVASEQ
ncbi:MAG: hypothetical protein LM573_06880 [Thermofilum sp.]|nr:hypothetical protein [Thermofilum sp.]